MTGLHHIKHEPSAKHAVANYLTFLFQCQESANKVGWTLFNQSPSSDKQEVTSLGYLPIIIAPTHEPDTLNVRRCIAISSYVGHEHTVIIVDQALYYKLMELKWSIPDYQHNLIPRLGGLHIALKYLKTIGDHTSGSGRPEVWVASGLLGEGTVQSVLSGKSYNEGMEAQNSPSRPFGEFLCQVYLSFIQDHDIEYFDAIISLITSDTVEHIAELIVLPQTGLLSTA